MFDTRIPIYGIFILIAITVGLITIYKSIKPLNYKKEEILGLLVNIFLGSIIGAKYFTLITNFKRYGSNYDFFKIGLSSYGAVIGILIVMFIYTKIIKKDFKQLLYTIMPSFPLMYGIGKIGCFFAGCCYGIKYNGLFSVVYNYSYNEIKGINLFPIQLLETITFIAIFIFISYKIKKEKNKNKILGQTIILCSLSKFFLDYLRMSHVGYILSINQIISILFFSIGIIVFLKKEKKF